MKNRGKNTLQRLVRRGGKKEKRSGGVRSVHLKSRNYNLKISKKPVICSKIVCDYP